MEEWKWLFQGNPHCGGNHVAGEVVAELKAVQPFGFCKVCGMVATSNQHRLVCMDATNEDSNNVAAMKAAWKKLLTFCANDAKNSDKELASQISVNDSQEQKQVKHEEDKDSSLELLVKIHGSQTVPDLNGKVQVQVENSG